MRAMKVSELAARLEQDSPDASPAELSQMCAMIFNNAEPEAVALLADSDLSFATMTAEAFATLRARDMDASANRIVKTINARGVLSAEDCLKLVAACFAMHRYLSLFLGDDELRDELDGAVSEAVDDANRRTPIQEVIDATMPGAMRTKEVVDRAIVGALRTKEAVDIALAGAERLEAGIKAITAACPVRTPAGWKPN